MSLSTIDQSTGNATLISGNVNDKVGNLAALTTTDKGSCVGAINEVKSKMICTQTSFNTDTQVFPVTIAPVNGWQVCILARNVATGAIYALWYNTEKNGFMIGHVLVGSIPSNGDTIVVQYFA